MLQLLSALGLLGTVLFVLACFRVRQVSRDWAGSGPAAMGRFPRCEQLLVWCAGTSLTVLALSGFVSRLRDEALSGYLLLLHVSCGAVLAAAFTLALLVLAARFGFEAEARTRLAYGWLHRIGFWLLAAMVIGLVVTPLLAMLPLAGTHGQELLVALHRLLGLGAIVLAMLLTRAEAHVRASLRGG